MREVHLKSGREKSVLRRHPWVFSGSISYAEEGIKPGEVVDILDYQGRTLARGSFSPDSRIRVRIWTWDLSETIDGELIKSRIKRALEYRECFVNKMGTNAYRLVYGEADGLPGFVVDRYADYAVVQCSTTGAERWRDTFVDILSEVSGLQNFYERSDIDVRKLEGLQPWAGTMKGLNPPDLFKISENNLDFWVDVRKGHKTGFYLDQRDNREWVKKYALGRHVLDCFAFTGGFTISALTGGAKSVVAVEASSENLEIAKKNCALNGFSPDDVEWTEGDVFKVLRKFRDRGSKFDLIVLDPPKFAPTSGHIQKAARGYKDINLLGLKLLRPNGLLFTFSCSGGVNQELFQKIVAGAAFDAGAEVKIIKKLRQAADHPVSLSFPEGEYLKGLILQVS